MYTAVYSDVGSVRKANEDSYYVSDFENNNGYVIVADGMGGHKGGQMASKTAIEEINRTLDFKTVEKMNKEEIEQKIIECVENANMAVLTKALSDDSLFGMGTTLVLCLVINKVAYIANIGDSRLYVVRDNKMAQVTKDHSVVQMLIDSGEITEKEAKNHPNKNVITRAIGSDVKIEADIFYYKIKKNDYILLCTDGLSNMVDDSVILDVLTNENSLETAVNRLGQIANKNGGLDNITLAVLKY